MFEWVFFLMGEEPAWQHYLRLHVKAYLDVELEDVQSLIKQLNFEDKLDKKDFLSSLKEDAKSKIFPPRDLCELPDFLEKLALVLDDVGIKGLLNQNRYGKFRDEKGKGDAALYLAVVSYKLMQKYGLAPTSHPLVIIRE